MTKCCSVVRSENNKHFNKNICKYLWNSLLYDSAQHWTLWLNDRMSIKRIVAFYESYSRFMNEEGVHVISNDTTAFQENTCRFRISYGNVRCRWYRNSGISCRRFIPYTRSYPFRVLSCWTAEHRSIYHRYCFIYRAFTRLERSSLTSLTRDNARKIHHGGIALACLYCAVEN